MDSRLLTFVLAFAFVGSGLGWLPKASTYRFPGSNQGYEPAQPIAFSHRQHSGELRVPCLYCHWAAEKSHYAGIPAAGICMNCHRTVTASSRAVRAEAERALRERREPRLLTSPEIRKIYDHLGLGDDRERDPDKPVTPIEWSLVYSMPDFVYFDHRAHVGVGVACQRCHGPVETMERIRQEGDLSMGWCVDCHREATRDSAGARKVNASIDCSICHR